MIVLAKLIGVAVIAITLGAGAYLLATKIRFSNPDKSEGDKE